MSKKKKKKVVPENFTPSTLVGATYANGEDVALGNFIKPSESADIPKVTFVAPDETAEYTLLVVQLEQNLREILEGFFFLLILNTFVG